jgi:hypothetical protein
MTKDELEHERQVLKQNERRGAWMYMGGPRAGGVVTDFEHVFVQRRQSKTTKMIEQNDRNSMLSVIANSDEVEAYIVDQALMDFFPEHIQKQLCSKLIDCFEADRPYMLKNVQKIKDKFREWDVYKVKMVQEKLIDQWAIRDIEKHKNGTVLER